MGFDTYCGRHDDEKHDEWRALVSELVRWERPVPKDKDNCPWKVYRGSDWEKRSFWRDDNGKPSIRRKNAFVHSTTREWKEFDKSVKRNKPNITEVTDAQIKNNHIRESLVHELLKVMSA